MKNYIYVPGLSESVEKELEQIKKKEANEKFITTTGAVKKKVISNNNDKKATRKVDDRESIKIPIWEKYALTIKEASAYYNIAETKLRDFMLNNREEAFVLKGGARLLVKRKLFEEFLDQNNMI